MAANCDICVSGEPLDSWPAEPAEYGEDRDYPLVLRYEPPADWLKPLGLPSAPPRHEQGRALIQVKDEHKQLIDFRDTERTDRMRHRLVEINEATSGLVIQLPDGVGEREGDLLWIGDVCLNLGNTSFYRTFNIDFRHGGRLYGHWIQGVPKKLRKQLTINGEAVAEPDFEAHHITILYALEGLQLPG